jgi:hypothetical protein
MGPVVVAVDTTRMVAVEVAVEAVLVALVAMPSTLPTRRARKAPVPEADGALQAVVVVAP